MVINLNIIADDINTFEDSNTMGKFCQMFGPIGKHYFQSESVDFSLLYSVPNKVHAEVT